jgi:hypothetical protein
MDGLHRVDERDLGGRAVASEPTDFHQAPDAEDVQRIYRRLATEVRCPSPWRR